MSVDAFRTLLKLYTDQAGPQQTQQHQQDIYGSDTCSSTHPATASTHAGQCHNQHTDPLSSPVHQVLQQLLATSVVRSDKGYAAPIVDIMLELGADMQPGASMLFVLHAAA
jgi:hypothetical protein